MPGNPVLLLVGGTGFVGGHLAPALVAAFPRHRRVMLSRGEASARPDWETLEGDLSDAVAMDRIVAELRPEVVIHLAAQASVVSDPNATWVVNCGGTFNLARAVARHVPRGLFFFSSSGEIYGESFNDGPAREDTAPRPMNAYAGSKLAAEAVLRALLPQEWRLVIARAFNHTGPGQDERFVLPSFAAQIARIEAGQIAPRIRVGNLAAERDFLHVKDVVAAYIALLHYEGPERRILVNVASGHVYGISDLLERLRGSARRPFEVEIDPARMRPSDIPCAAGDPSLLKQLVNWTPRHSIQETLDELLDWWRAAVLSGRGEGVSTNH
ncbi:GDP-mannose 4,6-dehydratase [Azorhizobium caulinodans]|uniref:GDP-6-deoxy-D-lyxo-4-hexulose reductase n=1 Tax=Azorhizobium caulinodans (strain ATCC 43989 / DSM 5975 / JCM 20966 / LMG 6465 / NBRC 14845 / NCIMB 13405 / ORS 571) TaxID=438753 RepID=A8IG80_AZOC5|nr:GDP-mannose 4,6-dehydratase [Azorhizobium caulinodans]BAF86051.1 GDP-6-deoxy-D-lyxo-4-hexulose reductase [Azorhizobium caulinodans ORS 571]